MGAELVKGGGRRNIGENILRINIQNPSSGHFNQQGMMTEKIRAKYGNKDRRQLEGPLEVT